MLRWKPVVPHDDYDHSENGDHYDQPAYRFHTAEEIHLDQTGTVKDLEGQEAELDIVFPSSSPALRERVK